MKIILTEDVSGLGDIGETVTVRPGYARNFLIPRGLGVELGAKSAGQLAHKMTQIEAKKRRFKGAAQSIAERIRELNAQFELKVNQAGKVFGSVTAKDIADKLTSLGFETDRRKVLLTEPLKKVGTHFVKIKLHHEVDVQLKVVIEAVEASKEEEESAVKTAKDQLETASSKRSASAEAVESE